jgi:hypothetical protein
MSANPSWLAKEHNLGQKKLSRLLVASWTSLSCLRKQHITLFSLLVSVTNLTMFFENQLNDDVNREATNMH